MEVVHWDYMLGVCAVSVMKKNCAVKGITSADKTEYSTYKLWTITKKEKSLNNRVL